MKWGTTEGEIGHTGIAFVVGFGSGEEEGEEPGGIRVEFFEREEIVEVRVRVRVQGVGIGVGAGEDGVIRGGGGGGGVKEEGFAGSSGGREDDEKEGQEEEEGERKR